MNIDKVIDAIANNVPASRPTTTAKIKQIQLESGLDDYDFLDALTYLESLGMIQIRKGNLQIKHINISTSLMISCENNAFF